MRSKILPPALILGLGAIVTTGTSADGDDREIITVGFGAGMNTAIVPGDPLNHHVIPDDIRIEVGDVVNFVVAGFHVIRVYDNGVRLRDVKAVIPLACQTNPVDVVAHPECLFGVTTPPPIPIIPIRPTLPTIYLGINGLNLTQPGPPFAQASAASNRVEAVSFLKAGRFLVICAVLPHFNDAMYAWVEVRNKSNNGNHNGHD